jgi:hypothetical protein
MSRASLTQAADAAQSRSRVAETRVLSGIFPHLFHDGRLYASRNNRVLVSEDMAESWQEICEVPRTPLDRLTRFRLVDRLFSWSIMNIARTQSGTLLIVAKRVLFRFSPDESAKPKSVFEIAHKHSPMHRGLCVSADGTIYLAEYGANPDRGAVHIYGSADDGRTWEVVHEFRPGEIRHVHAIQQDPDLKDRIWLLTGDLGDECRIAYTVDGFETIEVVGSGSQAWRAVSLLFREEHVYWGMDSPLETSYIQRISRRTGELERLQELDGPAYYGAVNAQGRMFIGTTVEKGPGVKDSTARIWTSQDGETWEVVHRHRGGRIPQTGIIYFPNGLMPQDQLVYRCRALARDDNKAFVCRMPLGSGDS